MIDTHYLWWGSVYGSKTVPCIAHWDAMGFCRDVPPCQGSLSVKWRANPTAFRGGELGFPSLQHLLKIVWCPFSHSKKGALRVITDCPQLWDMLIILMWPSGKETEPRSPQFQSLAFMGKKRLFCKPLRSCSVNVGKWRNSVHYSWKGTKVSHYWVELGSNLLHLQTLFSNILFDMLVCFINR